MADKPKAATNLATGERGEAIAVAFLKGLKYKIVERNFRCQAGEIDIIARDSGTLVFVEVKTRKNNMYGPPQSAVTSFKQRQISKVALIWLARRKLTHPIARFDVVAIVLPLHDVPVIEHIQNAFDLAY